MNWQERDGVVWAEAAQLSELPAGKPYVVLLSPSMPGWKQRHDVEAFITAGTEDGPIVISSECTHQSCPVEWKGELYVCPCHGSAFGADGGLLSGPAKTPLRKLDYFVDGETIWVKVRDKA